MNITLNMNKNMIEQPNSNYNNHSESSTISYRNAVNYGYASGLEVSSDTALEKDRTLSMSSQISFFFSEYFKGFLFVFLTSVFILAVPRLWTNKGARALMITDFLKRTMDIIGSIVGLILTLPAWLLVPIIIKLDSRGPVFYSQVRVGIDRRKKARRVLNKVGVTDQRSRDRRRDNYNGKLFKVYKFRTMVNDAEKATGAVWATKNDSRITRIGNFLRKTRIDEIPQFFNVLKGEMSLVGPRPERPEFVENLSQKVDNYLGRLEVKPGLTGLAQVENGYDSSVSSVVNKVRYDLEYIENRSIWLDIKILFKTVYVVLTGKGAH